MGGSQSRLTHDVVIKSTKDTRILVDEIFRFMQKELNLRDFYKLSVPAECDKYIVIMTNFLDSLFSRLQLVPIKNKAGVLYFSKIDDFKKDDRIKSERRAGCILLSYFYVRILQIYGALALTVIDEAQQFATSIEGQEGMPYSSRLAIGFQKDTLKGGAGGDGNEVEYTGTVLAPPGGVVYPPGYSYAPPLPQYYGQFGTRQSVISGQKFNFKEEPLSALNALGPKYKSSESKTLIFDNISKFFLKITETDLNIFGKYPYISNEKRNLAQEIKEFFNIQYDISGSLFQDSEAYLSLDLDKSETSIKTGKLSLRIIPTTVGTEDTPKEISIGFRIRGYTTETGSTTNLEEDTTDEGKETQAQTGKIRIRMTDVTIANSLLRNYPPKKLSQERFIIKKDTTYKVQKFTNSFKMLNVDDYFKKIIYLILLDSQIISILYPNKIRRKTAEIIYKEAGVPPELDIADLLNILQKPKKPRPYCISRALQLLTSNPTNNEKYTNICVKDFKSFGVEQPLYEKSIALPGNELASISAVSTLDNLFKDTFEFVKSTDNKSFSLEFRRSQNAIDIYRNFLLKMIKVFSGNQAEQVNEIVRVKDSRSLKKCENYSVSGTFVLNQEQLKRLDSKVQSSILKLFQIQITHTAKVGRLLQRLFIRRKLPTGEFGIFLHPDLLNKGFIRLQELNREAYTILVDYFTTCEQTYADGQVAMLESLKPSGNLVARAKEYAMAKKEEQTKEKVKQILEKK